VKLYRQDASSADSQISYYLKGAVVALMLDLHLRRQGSCLAVVLRALWRSHGTWGRGYHNDDLVAAFAEQAADLAELLPHWLESTEDPDLSGYLADVGLALVPKPSTEPFLGWLLEDATDRPMQLKRVHREGPAERACLQPGDELLALDGVRLRRPDDISLAIGPTTTPAERELLYCRDGRVHSTVLLPEPPAVASWQLVIDPLLVSDQTGLNRRRWLSLQP
jgi:predicted metalloprotease with PDZ domain